jgi:hypothetical protein
MSYIHNKGNPTSSIWIVTLRPLPGDEERKYIFSSGLGYIYDKMLREAGIEDYFVTCYFPDPDNPFAARNIDGQINQYQPKIIIPLDSTGSKMCPELVPKIQGKKYNSEVHSEISKYCGSLLTSRDFKYPHFVMPLIGPSLISKMYKLRDQVLLDLVKAKYELDYIRTNFTTQPLPERQLITSFDCFDQLIYNIDSLLDVDKVANDIETCYPKADSAFFGKTPGLPIVAALASSPTYSFSFDMFREKVSETRELWRHLDKVFRNCITIGQNFYNFDLYYYESLGFVFREIRDTLIRHHTLWPELPHTLQHMTRQYTREPYYKDEGDGWSPKNMQGLKRYNALDSAVTYEVYLAMEEEFDERPYLR